MKKQINPDKKAQALLELAIFGSILIMLLGVLVNYGLRYNYQQQAMQQAYRKALKSAAESVGDGKPAAVTHVLIKDSHIPNPSNPLGLGSVMPISASASVTRNHKLQEVAITRDELPQITMDVNGQILIRKTAGFRYESNVPVESKDKYAEIYGSLNVCWEEDCGASEGVCGGASCKNIKIIDSCAGEIMDYGTAVRQCRQIVDVEVCKKECERGKQPGSDTDCNSICNQTMNVPWYCANYTETDSNTHKYTFPVLNQLFNFAIASNKPKNMGLQQDYTQKTRMDNSTLHKTETTSSIETTDNVNYKDTIQRTIIYNDVLDASGVSGGVVDIKQPPVTTTTQITTCERNSTDCLYGYKMVTCSGEDCGNTAGGKTWQTNW